MKIHSEDHSATLRLESCGAELVAYPSLCISVDLASPLASGGHGEIWLELAAVNTFLQDLGRLDKYRTGEALLVAMSPEEFKLSFSPLDSLGHLMLEVAISGIRYRSKRSFRYRVESSFEIDPTSIPCVIAGFKEMIEEQKNV